MKPNEINEDVLNQENTRLAEGYWKKYKKQMQSLENGLVNKAMTLSEHHMAQLGMQLDQWEKYTQMMESNGSLNSLGELPTVALDVITATLSESILPVISSIQTIKAQNSLIWFKDIVALDSKGNVTAGDVMVNPTEGVKTPQGYASAQVTGEDSGDTTTGTFAYTHTVNGGESIRRQNVKIYLLSDPAVFAKDFDGKGKAYGEGMSAVIDYATGIIEVTLSADPATGDKIMVDYVQNLEEMSDVRRLGSQLRSDNIVAIPYALKGVAGMFQMFELKQTFGDSALQDMTDDLVRGINAEIGGDLISKYKANAQGTTLFQEYNPLVHTGVPEADHNAAYAYRRADAESVIMSNSGRGVIKVVIAGHLHCAKLRGMDGFNLLSDGGSLGAHIFGTHKGVTYVRVPDESILDKRAGLGIFTGTKPLESAGVYAPYMPLTIGASPLGPNPLTEQKVAASMAGTKCVVPAYVTNFNVAVTPNP